MTHRLKYFSSLLLLCAFLFSMAGQSTALAVTSELQSPDGNVTFITETYTSNDIPFTTESNLTTETSPETANQTDSEPNQPIQTEPPTQQTEQSEAGTVENPDSNKNGYSSHTENSNTQPCAPVPSTPQDPAVSAASTEVEAQNAEPTSSEQPETTQATTPESFVPEGQLTDPTQPATEETSPSSSNSLDSTAPEENIPSVEQTSAVAPESSSSETADTECAGNGLAEASENFSQDGKIESQVELINTSDVVAHTEFLSEAESGQNTIESKKDNVVDTQMDTGNINLYANVLTLANVNTMMSDLLVTAENFENLTRDLTLNFPSLTVGERAQMLVAGVCDETETPCQTLTSFKLKNLNSADVHNEVSMFGSSGSNAIKAGDDATKVGINTGDVNIVVNILTIANANLIGSTLTVIAYNIFGENYQHNIVLPSEYELAEFLSLGGSARALTDAEQVIVKIVDESVAEVINNVTLSNDTGTNSLTSVSDGIKDSSIDTGDTQAAVAANSLTNHNLFNAKVFVGFLNFMADMSGHIFGLPEQLAYSDGPLGVMLLGMSGMNGEELAELANEAAEQTQTTERENGTVSTSHIEDQAENQGSEVSIAENNDADTSVEEIESYNTAKITNDVNLEAITGRNSITAGDDISLARIKTGKARTLASILNLVNFNLIYSDMYIAMINVFGDMTGDVLFGYADLTASHANLETTFPTASDEELQTQITFANRSGARVPQALGYYRFDPAFTDVVSISFDPSRISVSPGLITFSLPELGPNQEVSIDLVLKTLSQVPTLTNLPSYTSIYTSYPEINQENNQTVKYWQVTQPDASTNPGSSEEGEENTTGQNGQTGDNPGTQTEQTNSGTGEGNNDQGNTQPSSGNQENTPSDQTNQNNPPQNNQQPQAQQTQQQNPPPQQGQQSSPAKLTVTKTNNASGPVARTASVDFTITVTNNTNEPINTVVLYDVLRGPDGQIEGEQSIDLETMKAGEEVTISYTLPLSVLPSLGQYTNTALARGILPNLTLYASTPASSSFTLGTENPQAQNELEDKNKDQKEEPLLPEKVTQPEKPETLPDGQVLGSTDDQKLPPSKPLKPTSLQTSRGQKTSSNPGAQLVSLPNTESNATMVDSSSPYWDILDGQAQDAEAAFRGTEALFDYGGADAKTIRQRQTISLVLICFLVAFGYALSELFSRNRKKRAYVGSKRLISKWANKFTLF